MPAQLHQDRPAYLWEQQREAVTVPDNGHRP